MTTNTNMTAKESAANITRIVGLVAGNLQRYREYVQEGGIAVMRHAQAFGDVSLAIKLMRALNPKDRSQFYNWLSKHSPCRVTLGKEPSDDKCRLAKPGDDGQRQPFEFDAASVNNWWEFEKPERVTTPKALLDFFDTMQKSVTMTDAKLERYTADEREAIKAVAKTLSATITTMRAEAALAANAHSAAAAAALLGMGSTRLTISNAANRLAA
jgi:hypothetical protein